MSVPTISRDELRRLLEQGAPITVLDVRPGAERAEWTIPGSIHIDAYAALRRGDPGALDGFTAPAGGPVVTVCAAGNTSRVAVERLRARGIEAVSLEGGMRGWSLAWNTASVPVPGRGPAVVQVRRTGKGCLSYLIGSDGEAAVIDPSLDPSVYLDLAERHGWRLRAVFETHVHADHLSRARMLAAAAGATLYLPVTERVRFPHASLSDGDSIPLASASLRVLATPGHTIESTCFLLDDRALFTGDTLFLNGVGRPDLEATEDQARQRAHVLYASLQRLLALPADTVVLPAHSSEAVPFDGHPLSASLATVRSHTPVLEEPEAAFVRWVLARIPPTPPNHRRIVALNEAGMPAEGDPTELEAGGNRCAVA